MREGLGGGMGSSMGGGRMGGMAPPLGMGYGRRNEFGMDGGRGGGRGGFSTGGGPASGAFGNFSDGGPNAGPFGNSVDRQGGFGMGAPAYRPDGDNNRFGNNFNTDSYSGNPGFSGFGENYLIKMRGIPFTANISDVTSFFAGVAKVVDAEIQYGMDGRPSGSAEVLFGSLSDAKAAMGKHKSNMGSRYVELFFEGPI